MRQDHFKSEVLGRGSQCSSNCRTASIHVVTEDFEFYKDALGQGGSAFSSLCFR
jgi:hypothetical protein